MANAARRRRPGRALILAAEPGDVPIELVAQSAGNDGYRTAVAVLGRRDLEVVPRDDVPLVDRLHEAVVAAGGSATSAAWQFPLRQAGLKFQPPQIVEAWDRVNPRGGITELHARLVREIRTWRPEAILTGSSDPEQDEAVVSLVRQAVVEAADEAARADAFGDQIAEAGLVPWRAKQIYAAMPPGGAERRRTRAPASWPPHWDARWPRRRPSRAAYCVPISRPRRRRSASSRSATNRRRNPIAAGPAERPGNRTGRAGAAAKCRPRRRPRRWTRRNGWPEKAATSGRFSIARCAAGLPANSCWPNSTS